MTFDLLFLLYYCIISLIKCQICLILLKMIRLIISEDMQYQSCTFSILPFLFQFEGATGKYVTRGGSKFK